MHKSKRETKGFHLRIGAESFLPLSRWIGAEPTPPDQQFIPSIGCHNSWGQFPGAHSLKTPALETLEMIREVGVVRVGLS